MKKLRVLFIHHSTGGLLIRFGRIRELLREKAPHIEFWDHGYDLYPIKLLSFFSSPITFHTGLTDGSGKLTGTDFRISISNNSPREYADIFSRDTSDPTLKSVLSFDVIAFKNCFPTTKIKTEGKLKDHKAYYSKIISSISKQPNLFILFTPPPVRREMTRPDWAHRARNLADWLRTEVSRMQTKNVVVFDFFDLLSDKYGINTNMLRREYCTPFFFDSHPNVRANRTIGKLFVECLIANTSLVS